MWIETPESQETLYLTEVTPHAGVWIETVPTELYGLAVASSLPTRECGLKPCFTKLMLPNDVTPHAGVWIETEQNRQKDNIHVSLPTRECGLKHKEYQSPAAMVGHSPRGSVD